MRLRVKSLKRMERHHSQNPICGCTAPETMDFLPSRCMNISPHGMENMPKNYLLDERIPISNNFAKNSARPYAVGRKNFMFHNSTDGAETSAIIYSLVESAKRNKLNVMKYLEKVLIEMMGYNDESENIDELMPWTDKMRRSCSTDQKNETEK